MHVRVLNAHGSNLVDMRNGTLSECVLTNLAKVKTVWSICCQQTFDSHIADSSITFRVFSAPRLISIKGVG